MPVNRHFDLLAPFYDRLIRFLKLKKLRRLLQLPVEGRLLDAGGGTGRVSARLLPWVQEIVVSDLSPPMLRQAKAKGGLQPVCAHAEKLPFADDCFDRVLVVDALHHFCDPQAAVRELIRVLKPGGRMVIEEPDIRHWAVKAVALAERIALMGSRFLPPAEIARIAGEKGDPVRLEGHKGYIAWVLVDKAVGDKSPAGRQTGFPIRTEA